MRKHQGSTGSRARTGRVAGISLALIAALTMSACATPGETPGKSAGPGAAGGTLTIAQADQILNLDPFTIPTGGRETRAAKRQIFDAMVVQDDSLQPQPQLALEWENPDDLTWVFTLRDDVTFHNGEKFNAETVKENFDLILDPEGGSPSHTKFVSMLESVEVNDDYTITFTTIHPSSSLMTALAFQEIVPSKHRAEVGGEAFNAAPVGSGPFVFEQQTKDRVVLKRNDDYWGEVPLVDKVVFSHIPEVSTRIAALQANEVSIADQIPGDLAPTITGAANAVAVDGTRIYFVGMNVEMAPFNDVAVRRAVAQATDTKALAEFLYAGNAIALDQPAFPAMFGYQKDAKVIDFDPEAARATLSAVTEPVTVHVSQSDLTLAQAVIGQWSDAGLKVTLQAMEDEAFSVSREAGKSQIYVSSWGVAEGDLDAILTRHFWSERDDTSKYTNYSNPEADALIRAGRSTVDADKRMEIYAELIDLLNEDSPWVPLVTPGEFYGTSKSLSGWEPSPTGMYRLNTAAVQ